MGLKVLLPGALSTIQDRGRYGYQALGVPVSGAMDMEAFLAANSLLGNDRDDAEIEMTLLGGTFTFDSPASIVLTGADMTPRKNGVPIPMWEAVDVLAGDTVSLGYAVDGCRAYLAVAGGFDVPLVMGSRSTSVRCQIGGLEGRQLQAGDHLDFLTASERKPPAGDGLFADEGLMRAERSSGSDCGLGRSAMGMAARRSEAGPRYGSSFSVRAMPGPQDDRFTRAGTDTFFSSVYTMQEGSDRMGIRLFGEKIESVSGTDIISDGTVFGSVQITSSGQPIVLMADRQTTGGYAKIATVLSADLPKLAQMKPGDTVRFVRACV